MHKLKAFTLLELLVGMVISSLVIGFCVLGYLIINQQYLSYRFTKTAITDVVLMKTVITSDFNNSNKIHSENENELVIDNDSGQSISYRFTDEFIVREKEEITDTFKIATSNYVPVHISGNDNEQLELVQAFSFDANVLGEPEHFNFEKNYAADVIINSISKK